MPTIIHKDRMRAGSGPARTIILRRAVCLFSFCLLYSTLISILGCSSGPSVDALLVTANSHLADAEKAGAGQYAKSELDEATAALAEAEAAIQSKDKSARVLVGKALAKARLAEALAQQAKAEEETTQLEAELEVIFSEADQARQDRRSAESELERISSEQ
jgi:hypothetical protein